MANQNNSLTNSQSLVIEKNEFDYITVAQENDQATEVKFQLMNPEIRMGDVLVVLDKTDVLFHGLIGRIEDGWAFATDPRGSMLPAEKI